MTSPDIQLLARHLKKSKDRGDSVAACCPFHDDSTPSFITYAGGAAYCQKCGPFHWKQVYEKLGLEIPPDDAQRTQSIQTARILYEYHNADGNCVARVERIPLEDGGKKFNQYTIEDCKWVAKKCYPLPLFQLPRLRDAAPGSTVFIVEGEKCVEAVQAVGGVATTAAGGSNGLKHADLDGLKHLRGKRCIILPDNDDSGEAYAQSWLVELRKRGIDAYVVRLPNAGRKKYDVYDYLAEGAGDLNALVAIADEQRSLTREAQKLATDLSILVDSLRNGGKVAEIKREALSAIASSASFTMLDGPVTLSEAMRALGGEMEEGLTAQRVYTGLTSVDSVTHGFRQKKQLVVIGGAPGAGKTALVTQLAEYWARVYGPVHITSAEMTAVELAERVAVRHFRQALEGPGAAHYSQVYSLADALEAVPVTIQAKAVTLDWLEADLRLWKALNPDASVAIVDYLQIIDRDEKEDDTKFVSVATRRLKKLSGELGIILVLLSQIKRGFRDGETPSTEAFLGGTAIEANCDVAAILWSDGCLHVLKNRHGETGKCRVAFEKPFMTFSAADPWSVEDDSEGRWKEVGL